MAIVIFNCFDYTLGCLSQKVIMQHPSKFMVSIGVLVLANIAIAISSSTSKTMLIASLMGAYLIIFAIGCSRIQWNFFLTSQNKLAQNNMPRIALTFDDGPTPQSEVILDILKKYNVKANFFLVGSRVAQFPDIALRMVNEGHSIGNHSQSHSHLINTKMTAALAQEILECNQTIYTHTGHATKLFRPPTA